MTDYTKEECYLTFENNAHLAIKFNIRTEWWFKVKDALILKCVFIAVAMTIILNLHINTKTVMLNDITIYEDFSAYNRLFIVVETYLNI